VLLVYRHSPLDLEGCGIGPGYSVYTRITNFKMQTFHVALAILHRHAVVESAYIVQTQNTHAHDSARANTMNSGCSVLVTITNNGFALM